MKYFLYFTLVLYEVEEVKMRVWNGGNVVSGENKLTLHPPPFPSAPPPPPSPPSPTVIPWQRWMQQWCGRRSCPRWTPRRCPSSLRLPPHIVRPCPPSGGVASCSVAARGAAVVTEGPPARLPPPLPSPPHPAGGQWRVAAQAGWTGSTPTRERGRRRRRRSLSFQINKWNTFYDPCSTSVDPYGLQPPCWKPNNSLSFLPGSLSCFLVSWWWASSLWFHTQVCKTNRCQRSSWDEGQSSALTNDQWATDKYNDGQ